MSDHSTKSNADADNEQQVNEDDLQMVKQTSISRASGLYYDWGGEERNW